MERIEVFYVMTRKWDNMNSCYYGELLKEFSQHKDADLFCRKYVGEEKTIYIDKAYINPNTSN